MLSVLNSFGVGSAVCDGDGRVLAADDAYLDILGWDRDKLRAINRDIVTHPEDRGRNLLLLDQQKRDGRPFEIAKRYVRPDGVAVWVQNRVSLLHGDGQVRTLVLSRPLPEEDGPGGGAGQACKMSFAGVISETAYAFGLQARRLSLPRTAGLLESAAQAAIPEAQA